MSDYNELVNEITGEIAKKIVEHTQNAELALTPTELLGQVVLPIISGILRMTSDMLLAEGKPRTQCRIQLQVDEQKIELAHGWAEKTNANEQALTIDPDQLTIKEAVFMMRDAIEQSLQRCLEVLPQPYHRLGLALTSLEQVMAKILLSSGDVTVRDKLDAVTELTSSLQRALLLDGHPNLQPRTRH